MEKVQVHLSIAGLRSQTLEISWFALVLQVLVVSLDVQLLGRTDQGQPLNAHRDDLEGRGLVVLASSTELIGPVAYSHSADYSFFAVEDLADDAEAVRRLNLVIIFQETNATDPQVLVPLCVLVLLVGQ